MSTDIEANLGIEGINRPPTGPRASGSSIFDDGIPTSDELSAIDWVLSTTRSNRKTLDLERPVELEVVRECIELAMQAPAAHNDHRLHWLVITDEKKRAFIADVYSRVWQQMTRGERRKLRRWKGASQDAERTQDSANWLPDHLHEVPVFVIPVMAGLRHNNEALVKEWTRYMKENGPSVGIHDDPSTMWMDGGYFASIYPAVWSFQLALRARGLGSVLTVVHLAAEQLVSKELGLSETMVQTCLIPVAYTTKRVFKPGKRPALESRVHLNEWQRRTAQ